MAIVVPQLLAKWTSDAGFKGDAWVSIVAIGIAQGSNPSAAKGVWGVGPKDDGPAQAKAAKTLWDSKGAAGFPAGASGAYRLYMLPAAAAVASYVPIAGAAAAAGAAGDAVQGAATTVASVNEFVGRIAQSTFDPLWWQGLFYIMAGGAVFVIGTFQLINQGALRPGWSAVTRAAGRADITAYNAASYYRNLIKPLLKGHR